MDILTLELGDVTVSQALLEVKAALERHPGMPLRIMGRGDDMFRVNLERFLARLGRPAASHGEARGWRLEVPGGPAVPLPAPEPPRPIPLERSPRPALLLRSAFSPGDRALGRRLLFGVLEALPEGTPWLMLAHEAVELLDDPLAREIFQRLEARGTSVRLSGGSLSYLGRAAEGFQVAEDADWQALLACGGLTLL